MNRILSQAEVETLLKGVQDGKIKTEPSRNGSITVRKYDFREGTLLLSRLSALNGVSEKFAQSFKDSISSLILRAVDININPVEVISFGELTEMTPVPSSINIIKMNPLNIHSLFIIEAQLISVILEFYFGSPRAKTGEIKEKPFTPIEQRIIKKIAKLTIDDISDSFKDIVSLNPELLKVESNIQFINLFSPNDSLIKMEFQVVLNGFSGKTFLCIPPSLLESVKDTFLVTHRLQQQKRDRIDKKWVDTLLNAILNSHVEIVAELAKIELTFEELISLEVGNVLATGKRVDAEIPIKVQGVAKFGGIVGNSRGYQSVKITKIY